MLSTKLLVIFPITKHNRKVSIHAQKKDDVWDPDEQSRINDNKKWKRDQPPEDVWDIDKERDATRYKREALEALLRLKTKKEKKNDS
jgi:hypothetical protein